jgi:AraC-like DNA-binding protein
MNHRYEKVRPDLNEYIRTILILDDLPDSESSDLPLVTQSMTAMLCKIENNSSHITLFGKSVPNDRWKVKNNTTLIAFFFKPFALTTIFKLSVHELKEEPIELNTWNAQKAMALNVQLVHSRSMAEKIDILNHFIHTQILANTRDCQIIQRATDSLMQDPSPDALPRLLNELHLTERTFQRIFKKHVGITANEYRRICRFYAAFSQIKGGDFDTLTEVAYSNGYFDQSHFIHTFREFSEITPNDYLKSGLNRKK